MQTLSVEVQKALQIATNVHWEQKRKGIRDPYIIHVVAVTLMVSRHTDDQKVVCAALLHDVLEDVPDQVYSRADMERDFGTRVVQIVESVSEPKHAGMSKEEEKQTWQQRKEVYLQRIRESNDEGTILICAADKIHNLSSMVEGYRALGNAIWKNFNNPPDKKLWFYDQVYHSLAKKSDHRLVRELKEALNQATKALHIDIA